jgi:hypothetical protein
MTYDFNEVGREPGGRIDKKFRWEGSIVAASLLAASGAVSLAMRARSR